ncbi:MAG: hypothetical protein R3C10_09655 [Pirellulales bacterium]
MKFNDVTFDNSGNTTIDGELTVSGDLTIERLGNLNGDNVLVHGNVTTTDTSVGGTATIELVGTGDQTIDAAGGTGELHHVEIDKVSGTLTISDHIEISGDFTHTSGVVDASGSTVEFQGYNATISSGDVEFANVIFDNSGNTTIDGELTVSGDLTIGRLGNLNGDNVLVHGNVTTTDTSVVARPRSNWWARATRRSTQPVVPANCTTSRLTRCRAR